MAARPTLRLTRCCKCPRTLVMTACVCACLLLLLHYCRVNTPVVVWRPSHSPTWLHRIQGAWSVSGKRWLQVVPVLLEQPPLLEQLGLQTPRPHSLFLVNTCQTPPPHPHLACVHTSSWPQHLVCPNPQTRDRELDPRALFQQQPSEHRQLLDAAFEMYPYAVFVDAGSGVGELAVRAAMFGVRVVAVEAVWTNVARIRAAVWHENLGQLVTILWHAVARRRTFMVVHPGIGEGQQYSVSGLSPLRSPRGRLRGKREVVTALTLDDLTLWTNATSAVFKLDLGGWECQAVLGGQTFLQSRFVPYILMHWSSLGRRMTSAGSPCPAPVVKRMVFLLTSCGFSPYCAKKGILLPRRDFTSWNVEAVVWKHYRAKNIIPSIFEEMLE